MKTKKRYFVLPIIILAIAIMGVVATQPANSLTMDVNQVLRSYQPPG